jgi:hypothetical protein
MKRAGPLASSAPAAAATATTLPPSPSLCHSLSLSLSAVGFKKRGREKCSEKVIEVNARAVKLLTRFLDGSTFLIAVCISGDGGGEDWHSATYRGELRETPRARSWKESSDC